MQVNWQDTSMAVILVQNILKMNQPQTDCGDTVVLTLCHSMG